MKILIVSLFYEPLNNIAVTRLTNFTKYLKGFGNEVDVLTRHYAEKDINSSNLNKGMLPGDEFDADSYRTENVVYSKYKSSNSKLNFSNKLPKGVKGLYNLYQFDVFHYSFVEYGLKAFEKEYSNKSYDVIIASSPVPAALLLAKEISNQYGVKWVADFRDSYIDGTEDRLNGYIKKKVLNKVLDDCSGFIFVSNGMKDQNLKVLNTLNRNIPSEIVFNGFSEGTKSFDSPVINHVLEIKREYDKVLVYTGTIYKNRNLSFFLKGIEALKDNSIAVVIVGVQSSYIQEYKENYKSLNLFFFEKVDYATSIKIQSLADFLLLTIWKGYYTGFSGKIFEYLYSERPIILDYSPATDLSEYLKEYKNIFYCEEDHMKLGEILNSTIRTVINHKDQKLKLTRAYQIEKLNNFLVEKIIKN